MLPSLSLHLGYKSPLVTLHSELSQTSTLEQNPIAEVPHTNAMILDSLPSCLQQAALTCSLTSRLLA
jgi:hypothetical protein